MKTSGLRIVFTNVKFYIKIYQALNKHIKQGTLLNSTSVKVHVKPRSYLLHAPPITHYSPFRKETTCNKWKVSMENPQARNTNVYYIYLHYQY